MYATRHHTEARSSSYWTLVRDIVRAVCAFRSPNPLATQQPPPELKVEEVKEDSVPKGSACCPGGWDRLRRNSALRAAVLFIRHGGVCVYRCFYATPSAS